jgi:hypothetical protein
MVNEPRPTLGARVHVISFLTVDARDLAGRARYGGVTARE